MSSEWVEMQLCEIVAIKGGKRLPAGKSLQQEPNSHPYIRVRDVGQRNLPRNGLEYVPDELFPSISRYIVQPNDVILSIVGTIGALSIVDAHYNMASLTENCVKLHGLDRLDALFLYYCLSSPKGQQEIHRGTVGAVQPKLPIYNIEKINVFWPDRSFREKIASFLGTLDDCIALLRETNATLEAIAQALFKSWFVDFDPVHAKARGEAPQGMDDATAALFPDSFEESELGMIPKGWRVGTVSELGNVICGKTPPTSDPENYGDAVPFITIPDMHGLLAITSTSRALSIKGANSQTKKYLPAGSICVSCIATPGLVVQVTEPSQTNQQINSVVPFDKWGNSFPLFLLRRIGDKVRSGGSGGSVFHNLSKSGFERIQELLPDQLIANCFNQVVDPLVSKIIENQRQAQTLAQLRDTLLPKLISGQLRLPEAEALLAEERP